MTTSTTPPRAPAPAAATAVPAAVPTTTTQTPAALVFGASGEEGRAVVEGLVNCGRYQPVYAFTRHKKPHDATAMYLRDGLGATLLSYGNDHDHDHGNGGGGGGADLENIDHVEKAFLETQATAIFLVTTTELPTVIGQTNGCSDAAEAEFQVICNFFHILKRVHAKDGISRHVIMSTRDNVQKAVRQEQQQQDDHNNNASSSFWIEPLDDGSIVPHYSAKGRGAEYAMEYLKNVKGLTLTLLTMPFFYSNFLGFFCPLPVVMADDDDDEDKADTRAVTTTTTAAAASSCTQWTLSACFGNGNQKIDMMAASDLSILVPRIFAAQNKNKYANKNIRLVAQCISMNEIAKQFSDLFGKDVIYNPLSYQEVLNLPIPAAGPMAQMCLFLSDPRSLSHDLQATLELYNDDSTSSDGGDSRSKKTTPTTFSDWLLTHSDSTAFTTTLLDVDAPTEILTVTVFGATTPEGISVTRGLLADPRKQYTKIRMAITDKNINNTADADEKEAAVTALFKAVLQSNGKKKNDGGIEKEDHEIPKCLEVVHADLDDLESCRAAVQDVEGVFLVTDFFRRDNMMEVEEAHAQNVIQACSSSDTTTTSSSTNNKRVQHLVFCTMESVEEMEREHAQLQNDAVETNDTHLDKPAGSSTGSTVMDGTTPREEQFHAKARTAALARTKKLSVTYVLLPCYSELFFDLIQRRPVSTTDADETNDGQEKEKLIFQVPTTMQQGEHKEGEETKVVCFSIDDLGPAVANIFDSYQVYAGHEIGLVTDFCTVSQVKEIIEQVFLQGKSNSNSDGSNNNAQAASTIEIEHVHDTGDGDNNKDTSPLQWKATDTYMKDLGQMFAYMARSDAVKRRHSIAKTMKLVPSARPLREWVEQNRDNPAFREKLGLR